MSITRVSGPNHWRWIATALVVIAAQALLAIVVKTGDPSTTMTNYGRSGSPRP